MRPARTPKDLLPPVPLDPGGQGGTLPCTPTSMTLAQDPLPEQVPEGAGDLAPPERGHLGAWALGDLKKTWLLKPDARTAPRPPSPGGVDTPDQGEPPDGPLELDLPPSPPIDDLQAR